MGWRGGSKTTLFFWSYWRIDLIRQSSLSCSFPFLDLVLLGGLFVLRPANFSKKFPSVPSYPHVLDPSFLQGQPFNLTKASLKTVNYTNKVLRKLRCWANLALYLSSVLLENSRQAQKAGGPLLHSCPSFCLRYNIKRGKRLEITCESEKERTECSVD